jgi:signal peptidase II
MTEQETPSVEESSAGRDAAGSQGASAARSFARTKWVVLIAIALVVVACDQLTKHWAHEELQRRPGGRITVVEGYAAFAYIRNPGAAWGFLARAKESFRQPFFVSISVLAMLFILYIHWRLEPGQHLLLVALSLVMGGALGNFIDRVRFSFVVDFIKVHWRHRYEWPTFNVADIAITVGVILLFAEMFLGPFLRRRRLRARASAAASSGEES